MKFNIDGREYAFPDFESLTFKEARLMKDATGLKMGAMVEAFEEMDTDVIIALALVAMTRQDGWVDTEKLYDLPISSIELVLDDVDKGTGEDAPLAPNNDSEDDNDETKGNESSNAE